MRNKIMIAGFLFGFVGAMLPQALLAAEQASQKQVTQQDLDKTPPDGTIDFEGSQMRLILGGSSGKGVLHYKGKDYPFTMKGASVGGVGYTEVQGAGTVHYLKKLEDFSGTYSGIGVGAALVEGKGSSTFQNNKGVVVQTKAKSGGAALNMGLSGVEVTLGK
jgi:hypothetical protein